MRFVVKLGGAALEDKKILHASGKAIADTKQAMRARARQKGAIRATANRARAAVKKAKAVIAS